MLLVFFTLTVHANTNARSTESVMVWLILAFRIISVIRTIHLSKQPSDQRDSDNRGYTVATVHVLKFWHWVGWQNMLLKVKISIYSKCIYNSMTTTKEWLCET